MKTKLLISAAMCFATNVFAQIDETLMQEKWKVGKEKVIYGNTVVRVEGKNELSGTMNIGYQTFEQAKAALEQKAQHENWTGDHKHKAIDELHKQADGGLVHLYLTSYTPDAANTDMFSVTIKDASDKHEIYHKDLPSHKPNIPSEGGRDWWNYYVLKVPKKIHGNAFVHITDKHHEHTFKFEIKR
jgi:hypothetical protein